MRVNERCRSSGNPRTTLHVKKRRRRKTVTAMNAAGRRGGAVMVMGRGRVWRRGDGVVRRCEGRSGAAEGDEESLEGNTGNTGSPDDGEPRLEALRAEPTNSAERARRRQASFGGGRRRKRAPRRRTFGDGDRASAAAAGGEVDAQVAADMAEALFAKTASAPDEKHLVSMKEIADAAAAAAAAAASEEDTGPWSWSEWQKHFAQVDIAEAECDALQQKLDSAVHDERYEDADEHLRALTDARQQTDYVGAIKEAMQFAIEDERYRDASVLRDEGGQSLCGWWAGRAVRNSAAGGGMTDAELDFPHGHLVHISSTHGRYIAKAYSPEDLLDEDGEEIATREQLASRGTPVFEIFVKPCMAMPSEATSVAKGLRDLSEGAFKMQACALRHSLVRDGSDDDSFHHIGTAGSVLIEDDDDDDDDEDDDVDVDEIVGFAEENDDMPGLYDENEDEDDDDDDGLPSVSWRIDNLGVGIDIIYSADIADEDSDGENDNVIEVGHGNEDDEDDDDDDEEDDDTVYVDQGGVRVSFNAKERRARSGASSADGRADAEDADDDDDHDDDDDIGSDIDGINSADLVEGGFVVGDGSDINADGESYDDSSENRRDRRRRRRRGSSGGFVEVSLSEVPAIEEAIALASGGPSVIERTRAEIVYRRPDSFVFEKASSANLASFGRRSMTSSTSTDDDDSTRVTTVATSTSSDSDSDRDPHSMLSATRALLSRHMGSKFLSGMTSFSRIPTTYYDDAAHDPFQGLFVGTFGAHGPEVVQLVRGFWGTDRVDDRDCITAFKVTGDANVPAGEPSFRVRVHRDARIRTPAMLLEMDIQERFRGEGRVAGEGYTSKRWVKGGLYKFSDDKLGFAWLVPGDTKFMIVFHKISFAL